MNKNYKYILPKTSRKEFCPACGMRTFKLFVDDRGNTWGKQYGRCERIYSCGNICFPDASKTPDYSIPKQPLAVIEKALDNSYSVIHSTKRMMRSFHGSRLFDWFVGIFGRQESVTIFSKYRVESYSSYYDTLFWQIDNKGKKRTGKLFQYNAETGKRVKKEDGRPIQNWVHSLEKIPDFQLKQCFFGQHLVTEKTREVAIVESEKTAMGMAIIAPQYTWIATGGLYLLGTLEKDFMKEKDILLYPDAANTQVTPNGKIIPKPYEIWSEKGLEMANKGFNVSISDRLEKLTTQEQKKEGFDLLDMVLTKK